MEAMDRKRLEEVLERAVERLSGEWLLLGGALVALWVEGRRTTEDVDLIGLGGSAEERYALMELAADLGLPIEAVNSAADFFVRRVKGWREELEPFRKGPTSVIYRPTATLFVLLKMGRLSDQDLQDCVAVIEKAKRDGLRLDVVRLREALDVLPESTDEALLERRSTLLAHLALP